MKKLVLSSILICSVMFQLGAQDAATRLMQAYTEKSDSLLVSLLDEWAADTLPYTTPDNNGYSQYGDYIEEMRPTIHAALLMEIRDSFNNIISQSTNIYAVVPEYVMFYAHNVHRNKDLPPLRANYGYVPTPERVYSYTLRLCSIYKGQKIIYLSSEREAILAEFLSQDPTNIEEFWRKRAFLNKYIPINRIFEKIVYYTYPYISAMSFRIGALAIFLGNAEIFQKCYSLRQDENTSYLHDSYRDKITIIKREKKRKKKRNRP